MKNNIKHLPFLLLVFFLHRVEAQQLAAGYQIKVKGTAYTGITNDAEGNIFVFGAFDHLQGEYYGRLLKLDATGKPATGFNKIYADGSIVKAHCLTDGKILISGGFTSINGSTTKNFVRLNPDGSLDETFNCGIDHVKSFKLQSNGKIVVLENNNFSRLNADGSIDDSFSAPYFVSDPSFAIGPDDDIYFIQYNSLYKLTPEGSEDGSFNFSSTNSAVTGLTIQSDGKILVSGYFPEFNTVMPWSFIRLNTNGEIDDQFDIVTGLNGPVLSAVEKSNGNIVISGNFNQFNDEHANLVELKPDGTLHKIIATVETNVITNIISSPDGGIIFSGEFNKVNGEIRWGMAKINSDYTLNDTFIPEITYNDPNSMAVSVRNNGSMLISGNYFFQGIYNGVAHTHEKILELNPLGGYNKKFIAEIGGDRTVYALEVQNDDKVVLSGPGDAGLIRLNSDGSKDNTFVIGAGPTYYSSPYSPHLLLEHNDILYVAGYMTAFNGVPSYGIVSLNHNGSIYKTYTSLSQNANITGLAFQSDGKMIITGNTLLPGNDAQIIRLNTDGSIDETFADTNLNGQTYCIAIDAQDRIYLGGDFTTDNSYINLIRLHSNGILDESFDAGSKFTRNESTVDVSARAITLLSDGKLAVGGYFGYYDGEQSPGFVILNEDGERVPTPLMSFGLSSVTIHMEYRNGMLYAAGRFLKDDYTDAYGIVKILIDPVDLPQAPGNLQATMQASGVATITWSDNSSDELGFVVERSVDNATTFIPIDTVWRNTTVFSDYRIIAEKKYFYRIRAVNDAGYSTYSNIDSVIWIPPPPENVTYSESEISKSHFVIYPVPTRNNLNVILPDKSSIGNIILTSMTGMNIPVNAYFTSGKVSIDLAEVPPGVYILEYRNNKFAAKGKVIKE